MEDIPEPSRQNTASVFLSLATFGPVLLNVHSTVHINTLDFTPEVNLLDNLSTLLDHRCMDHSSHVYCSTLDYHVSQLDVTNKVSTLDYCVPQPDDINKISSEYWNSLSPTSFTNHFRKTQVSPSTYSLPDIITTETLLSQMVFNNNNNNPPTNPCSVVNLSTLQLTEPMISVLSKGLNFCPTPGEPDVYQLRQDLDQFHVALKRKLYFAKRSDLDSSSFLDLSSSSLTPMTEENGPFEHQKFSNPSTWCPIAPSNLEAMIIFNESFLNEYIPRAPSNQNLSLAEKSAINSLKDNPDIVIKAADKGSAVVIQNRTDYIKEGIRQLSDGKFYSEVPYDLTDIHNNEVHTLVDKLFQNKEISQKCADYLRILKPRTPQLYLLPKIHKNTFPVPGRPIVSANNSPTERISQLVDHFLQPLVSNTKSYVKDTTDFLNKIQNVPQLPTGVILCTVDVTSLYTNIPNDEGIQACTKSLQAHRRKSGLQDEVPHTSSLMRLLEYVLTMNNFDFNSKHYLQVGGTAMGTRVAPSFANLFMADLEEKHVYTYPTKPSLWLRYIDDIFLIWEHGQDALDSFLDHLNSCHDTIKFTTEQSHKCVNFLDTTVHLSDTGALYTDLYCKPTDAHNYLAFASAHPDHTKISLPYSQLLRVRRICTNIEDYDKNAVMIGSHFRRRGYPDHIIEKAIIDVRRKSRENLLNPTPITQENKRDQDNLFLVTTHIPQGNPLKPIIQKTWKVLGRTHTTEPLYKLKTTFGQRRNKNLKDILVQATLPKVPTNPGPKPKGTKSMHSCHKYNCRYCTRLDKTGALVSSSTGRSYYTRNRVSCQSNNLIYCLTCTKCNLQYVGQTKNRLADRFSVHFNHIEPTRTPKRKKLKPLYSLNPKYDDPIGRHYKSTPHNGLKDVHIHILQFISAPSNSIPAKELRDSLERTWIHRLKTLSPLGLNLAD